MKRGQEKRGKGSKEKEDRQAKKKIKQSNETMQTSEPGQFFTKGHL